jgi:hypothetical protein
MGQLTFLPVLLLQSCLSSHIFLILHSALMLWLLLWKHDACYGLIGNMMMILLMHGLGGFWVGGSDW